MQKIVFSDVDGTLSKGFITADFLRWLNKTNNALINQAGFEKHEKLLETYARKEIEYIDLVPKWSQSVADCLKGKSVEKIIKKAKEFFEEWKKEGIYESTKELVKLMKEKGYLFILVSGGWEYLVELVEKEINADGFVGMKIGKNEGIFTNELINDVRTEKGKCEEIQKFFEKYGGEKEKAISLGDSPQDASIFKNTKKIVALNPNEELEKLAKEKDWFIATHKNIVEVMKNCFEKKKI